MSVIAKITLLAVRTALKSRQPQRHCFFLFVHPTLHMLLLATTKVILDAFISSHSHFLVLNKLCHVLLSFVSAFSVDNVLALFTMILWSLKPSEMHDYMQQ